MVVAADVVPGVFPNPEECEAGSVRVFEPAPYCKLAYEGPLRGPRSFAAFAVPALLPGRMLYLKKRRIHFAGLAWRFEYLRWRSGNGTKRRLHAGMIQDAVLLAVIEDLRRDLRPPTELGQRCMKTKPGWLPMIEVNFAAVRCVHTIVGWTALHPNEGAR